MRSLLVALLLSLAAVADAASRPELPFCPTSPDKGATPAQGDPRARAAAQRSLAFLTAEAKAWSKQNNCYGCHVHSVTLEALSFARHNQYNVSSDDFAAVLHSMLDVPGGARGPMGLSYHDNSLAAPSKAFGGAAFARYDEWVGQDIRRDLLRTAKELLQYQQSDGGIRLDWTNGPVGAGIVQGTYQAAQTWRQAYARSADDAWLPPLRRAEAFLAGAAAQLPAGGALQDINYAIMGLTAAGVGPSEKQMLKLEARLRERQGKDGGWSLGGGESDAFATGQSVYALRQLGRTDQDAAVERGTTWLMQHQAKDGGWSHGGRSRAEAMWGVLGLVSVDVLSVATSGIEDGTHVDGTLHIGAQVKDNSGRSVRQVELAIDDLPVTRSCGGELKYAWATAGLKPGKHVVDLTAQNGAGQTSRRRFEVYTGAVFMTQIGADSQEAETVVSLRNLAPEEPRAKVSVGIYAVDAKGNVGGELARLDQPARLGPMSFRWTGEVAGGKRAAAGKYVARLELRREGGVVQKEEIPFVRASYAAQQADYAQISGNLMLRAKSSAGAAAAPATAANAEVELLDDRGRVVQSTRSTASGAYRFKNVDAGAYKIRIRKDGFAPVERDIRAAKAAEAPADVALQAE